MAVAWPGATPTRKPSLLSLDCHTSQRNKLSRTTGQPAPFLWGWPEVRLWWQRGSQWKHLLSLSGCLTKLSHLGDSRTWEALLGVLGMPVHQHDQCHVGSCEVPLQMWVLLPGGPPSPFCVWSAFPQKKEARCFFPKRLSWGTWQEPPASSLSHCLQPLVARPGDHSACYSGTERGSQIFVDGVKPPSAWNRAGHLVGRQ